MKLKELGGQLKREVAANKGKAALLGGISLLAVYFWFPLLFGKPADKPQTKQIAAAPKLQIAAAKFQTGDTEPAKEVMPPWQDLVKWMAADPRMHSGQLSRAEVDPFKVATPLNALVDDDGGDEQAIRNAANQDVTPDSFGLELSSTLVGSRRSVVKIDGKTYVLGSPVGSNLESASTTNQVICMKEGIQFRFEIVEVGPGSVVLERNSKRFTLKIGSTKLAENETFELNSGSK